MAPFSHQAAAHVCCAEQSQIFVAARWRQLIYILLFYLPGLGIGVMFLAQLTQSSIYTQQLSDSIVRVMMMLFGFGMFLLWLAILHEKMEVTATSLVRTSILGRKSIPLSDILSARCGIQGRGNTLLIIETKHGRRRMGLSLPTKTVKDLADLLNSRVKPDSAVYPVRGHELWNDAQPHVPGDAPTSGEPLN
jgi:hypothetical protein